MLRAVWIALLVLVSGCLSIAVAQDKKSDQPASGWQFPVIQGYGDAWPLPDAAVQPDQHRTYRILFDVTKAAENPKDILPGLDHAARTLNVFATLGVPPSHIKMVAVFAGPATYGAMNDDIYRAQYKQDNPNIKLIHELKAAGVKLYLCGQALHGAKFEESQMVPDVKLATSAMLVLALYQNDGYALMPF